MCTAIALQSLPGTACLGRNMDFSYALEPHLYFVPRNAQRVDVQTREAASNPYSFMGIGQELDGVLAFFDGINEHGFAAASLYFAGCAKYDEAPARDASSMQVASYEFLMYILGHCASVKEFLEQIRDIRVIGRPDPLTHTVAPLHWIALDRLGRCVVLELTDRGTEIFCNPIGVLANSPGLAWHMTNLTNYLEVSPRQRGEAVWGGVRLTPFGQAGGTMPLPGGYTSPERFVRAAYLKTHLPAPKDTQDAAVSFFQVMKSVSIPKGAVVTARDTDDYTQYTACMDLNARRYFFNTYDNLQIRSADFPEDPTAAAKMADRGSILQPMTFEKM